MNPSDFIRANLVEVEEGKSSPTFFPPVPTQQPHSRAPLSGGSLILELLPALARITVELPREDQRRVNFQPGCPARLALERVVGMHILDCNTLGAQNHLIWLGRLARHALELADEIHQWDGQPCLQFSAGFVAGERCPANLFHGEQGEAEALERAAREYFGQSGVASRAFSLGFQTRRDQLRTARQAEIDNLG